MTAPRENNRPRSTTLHERYQALTAREREVMALVVSGMLNKQIASEIGASEATVKIHRGHVMEKMQAGSLIELVRMADKLKLSLVQIASSPAFCSPSRLFRATPVLIDYHLSSSFLD